MVQLNELIGNDKAVRIWRIFLDDPGNAFYFTQVVIKTGFSKTTVSKWLNHLAGDKLIESEQKGRERYFRLSKNPVNKFMKILINVSLLEPVSHIENAEVYLFGSCARGEDGIGSDADILVLGRASRSAISPIIAKAEKEFKRPIKPVVVTPVEWKIMQKQDPSFYERVEHDKVKLSWT